MGWLKRLFGLEKPKTNIPSTNPSVPQAKVTSLQVVASEESIPAERIGLNGEYDQSGLAKRVALAFDSDAAIDDIETLYVAQTGSTVVLKGKVPDRQILDKMVSVARSVSGATDVDTNQVEVS